MTLIEKNRSKSSWSFKFAKKPIKLNKSKYQFSFKTKFDPQLSGHSKRGLIVINKTTLLFDLSRI